MYDMNEEEEDDLVELLENEDVPGLEVLGAVLDEPGDRHIAYCNKCGASQRVYSLDMYVECHACGAVISINT
jgi:rRNA maturation endonuclease Nob1